MGLTGQRNSERKNFSSKVLKIELSGPNRSHFGILDLPGIFGSAIGDLKEEDIHAVEKMVISYMKKRENIIMWVTFLMLYWDVKTDCSSAVLPTPLMT